MKFASASKQVIPQDPFYLMGYVGPARANPAEGIHDIPEVNTMCIEIKGHQVIYSAVDVCVFSRDKANIVKKTLSEKYGLNGDDINIIAIHSHSCPNGTTASDRGFNEHNVNESFFNIVVKAIDETVSVCLDNLKEATAKYQITKVEGFYSNRNDKKAPYDNQAIEVHFIDHANNTLGILFNIACHSTVLGPTNMLCSSDLIGTIRTKLKERYHTNIIATMGAAGDISNRQYRQGDDFTELARCSSGIFTQISFTNDFKQLNINDYANKILDFVIDYDNTQYFAKYRQLLAETEAILADPKITKDQFKLSATSKKQFENKLKIDHIHREAITNIHDFGELTIVGFGGEMSSKFGMMIKNKNPNKLTIVITCCDDDIGYFIEAEKYGKYYETIATEVPLGAPEKITEQILASI